VARILSIASGIEGEGGGSFLQFLETLKSWQILLIAIAIAAVLGVVVGVIVGKYQLKRASGHYKPLLTLKQRLVYLALFALGAGCVLFGVFFDFSAPAADPDSSIAYEGEGAINPGVMGGVDSGIIDAPVAVVEPAMRFG
jgi:ABC-type proline/glycine betaine transport system permease subunit